MDLYLPLIFYYSYYFLYPDQITSVDHTGIKSNELFQLKQGLLVDFSDAKLNEVLKSNNLDVSDEIICLSLSKFPFPFFLFIPILYILLSE